MAGKEVVVFAEDEPEKIQVRVLEFYYPEHRSGEPSPFAMQDFTLNLTEGDEFRTGEGKFGFDPTDLVIYFKKQNGHVRVARGWVYMTDRVREVPRPKAPPAPRVPAIP